MKVPPRLNHAGPTLPYSPTMMARSHRVRDDADSLDVPKVARGRRSDSAGSMVGRHWPFLVILTVGAALRLIAIVGYTPILMLQRDTYAYLSLAENMDVTGWRPSLYPMMISPFVALGNLGLLALVQHLAGLAIAVALYALMRRLEVSRILACLGVVPVLLDGYVINLEHYLLTESFFFLFITVALLLLVYPRQPSIWHTGASGFVIGLTMLLRFVGASVIVPALGFVVLRRLGVARSVALIAGFALPLAAYSLYFSSQTGGSVGVTDSNGLFLYGRVVEFADCNAVEVPEELQEYCPSGPIESATKGVFTSGLDIKSVTEDPQGNAKLLRFSRLMILGMPGEYAQAVLSDFGRFFSPNDPESQEPNVKRWRFVRAVEEADPHPFVRDNGGSPPPSSNVDERFTIRRGAAGFLRSYQNVAYVYGPLLALMLILGLAGGIVAWRSEGHDRLLGPTALLFSLVALSLLIAPTMVAVYHFRYVLPAVVLSGPAGAMGLSILIRQWSVRRKSYPSQVRSSDRV